MSEQELTASDHESYGVFTVIAILIPLVGFIMGIAYMCKDKRIDRKLGEHLLATSIIAFIAWWGVVILFSSPY